MPSHSAVWDATRERLLARFGSRAQTWWDGLPALLSSTAARWRLSLGEPVGRGNTSLVVRCALADGTPAILKLTPDTAIAETEAHVLRAWLPSGRVPEVYGDDAGVLLLEAVPNETPLDEQGAEVPLTDVAALVTALHGVDVPEPGHGIGPQRERTDFLFGLWLGHCDDAELSAALARGHALAVELGDAPERTVLAHGDLHPGNVLDGGRRGLVAIDPRPCLGDPASDAIDWVLLGTPAQWPSRAEELAERAAFDEDRLWAWCSAFAARVASLEPDAERARALYELAV